MKVKKIMNTVYLQRVPFLSSGKTYLGHKNLWSWGTGKAFFES